MANNSEKPTARVETHLSRAGCVLVLVSAFLGWMFAGVQLSISSIAMPVAARDLLEAKFVELGISEVPLPSHANVGADLVTRFDNDEDGQLNAAEMSQAREVFIGPWFGRLIAAFLFGAAAGGYFFGWIGDRIGRSRAMALSILCYSVFSGATYFVNDLNQLMVMRFLTCLGVGGMWPNGIALVSEAWPNISRPFLAGAIGTAANVGIMLFSLLACFVYVTVDDWRWVPLVASAPVLLSLFVWFSVPESPHWLALREHEAKRGKPSSSLADVFRPPFVKTTIIGILLGTIPLFGGWGNSTWVQPWTAQVGDQRSSAGAETNRSETENADTDSERKTVTADPTLKAKASLWRSWPGSISSMLGGALAVLLGRRRCYFLLSLCAFGCSFYIYRFLYPTHPSFLYWFGVLGFFSGFFFGWLPLCLPELFPTRVRAAGAGVSFNFGRIITAIGVLVAAEMLKQWFAGDYALIGQFTSCIYLLGMVVILFVPDTSTRTLED